MKMDDNRKEDEEIINYITITRESDPKLPDTVTVLEGPLNGKVYLIGTAHFSEKSQREVVEVIQKVKPDYVMLELCNSRINILSMDEETVLREAKDLSLTKIRSLIASTNVMQGLLHVLLIRLYAKVTQELGLAPGGEFRAAYNEARKIPGCKVFLGDMPVNISLKRGFYSLPWYRKLKLAFTLLFTNHKLTQDDIEKLKNRDILDGLLVEFGASFPEFKKVLIDERDICLTHSLRSACKPVPNDFVKGGLSSVTVVGVVGLGHVNGIVNNWNKDLDVSDILKVPPPSNIGKYIKIGVLTSIALIGCKYIFQSRAKFPKIFK